MEMELYPLLSAVILVTTIMTVILALFSYVAYRARSRKQARRNVSLTAPGVAPISRVFRRYEPSL
ncbi:MAG TPA: hypothetical protein VKX49_08865 [Bryobacteraceae bacterium]|nr:hypothetical protein [Bryobacteraceae bacterium]